MRHSEIVASRTMRLLLNLEVRGEAILLDSLIFEVCGEALNIALSGVFESNHVGGTGA